MVLQMKVEAVNFRKSQEIWLLWLDCFITKFQNKWRGGANRSPPGPNRVKGLLPSTTKNHYFLTVVDEFSSFPFVFSCNDVSSHILILCLNLLFSLFGFPAIVHSDNAKCFVPKEIKLFLNERGIGSTFPSICSPRDNFQCELFNGMILNTIKLALRTRGSKTSQWEIAIPEFLHGLWLLVRTATSEVSHDRFFKFTHRSMFDTTVPTRMSEPGPVYVRKHAIWQIYSTSTVNEVDLLHANQNHAVVRYPEEREVTLSARDVAPTATTPSNRDPGDTSPLPVQVQSELVGDRRATTSMGPETCDEPETKLQTPLNWRSTR